MGAGLLDVLITVQFPDVMIEKLRQVSPRLRITAQTAHKVEEVPIELWNRAEILYTDRVLPDPLMVPNLKWIQFHFAGIDFASGSPLVSKNDIQVTTLSGAAAPQMAEYVIMMLLALGHRIPDLVANQEKAEWPHDRWERFGPRELRGSTVGIVGYGSIGREIARLLQPFHVQVLAVKRDVRHPEDTGYMLEGSGDPHGYYFTRLYPIEAIKSMLKLCDYLVVCLPLTRETRGLIGEEELSALKPKAYLVDIGRGGVVDQAALITALQEKRLTGAALDVFSEEPLPPSNPLWHMPQVLVTPHIGGLSASYRDRAVELFSENLKRYLEEMPLLNRFNPDLGY